MMKQNKVNLSVEKELAQHLQALAKEFGVPQNLLVQRVLWQFVSNAPES